MKLNVNATLNHGTRCHNNGINYISIYFQFNNFSFEIIRHEKKLLCEFCLLQNLITTYFKFLLLS